jgi:hypothetical protein
MLIYRRLRGKLAAEFIAERALEDSVDKIFVDEAVNELHTIQDMLRWAVSRFSAANIWYGHGTITRGMSRTAGDAFAVSAAGYSGRYAYRASDFQRKTPHR